MVKMALWALAALLGEFVAGLSTLGLFIALAVNAWAMIPVSFTMVAGVAWRNYSLAKT